MSSSTNGHKCGEPLTAWLSLADEDGGGLQAGLLLMDAGGEAVGFHFTRTFAPDADDALPRLLRAAPPPALALATQDAAARLPASDASIPVCLLAADGGAGRVSAGWHGRSPPERADARRLLDAILERNDPLGPFRRATDGLRVAFEDEHVRALLDDRGLVGVVSLGPPAVAGVTSDAASDVAQDGVGERRDGPLSRRLWAALRAPAAPVADPELEWPGALMPFQRDGVRALMGNQSLLLADDMGLGKTIQAIGALRLLHHQGDIRSALVVAPASVLDQWRAELEKWAPELSAIIVRGNAADRSLFWTANRDVTLVGYETLLSDFSRGEKSPVLWKTWDVVISDEAQRMKNRNPTSHALKGLRRVRSWALTGTPIENHEEELASILEFVDYDDEGLTKRYHPGEELRARHRELQLRRKKGDVLADLPPKRETLIPIELDPQQRASYDKAEDEGIVYLKSLGAEVSVTHILELITRLKQICNADPRSGESSKLADIGERLGQLAAQGHKALVFSQYTNATSGVAAAARHLREYAPLTLTGEVPQDERQEVIGRFRTRPEHKALILSLRVGGLGLNLQEASYVFHLDRWWNPATERQAEDRAHRMGQQAKVNVIKYSCVDTIEQRIDDILKGKQALFDELVDNVSLEPDLTGRLSEDELFGLFGLERAVRPGRG